MAPRCSVFVATSLDGFIARLDGGLDWLSVVERTGEDYGYKAFFDSVDAVVLGRRTYESVLRFDPWPYAKKPCVVLTHGAPRALHGEEFYAGSPSDLVQRRSLAGARRIYVDGGDVIRQFLAAGLVDDLTLSTIPVLLGDGVRLFGGTGADIRLTLVASRSFPSGLVQHEYEVRC